MRARKTCSAPGCPNLQPCADHARKAWVGKQGRHGRMRSGSLEQKINRAVMLRDEGICQDGRVCQREALATQVDHVIPLSEGGSDDMDNRRAICIPCHQAKTQQEAQRARTR